MHSSPPKEPGNSRSPSSRLRYSLKTSSDSRRLLRVATARATLQSQSSETGSFLDPHPDPDYAGIQDQLRSVRDALKVALEKLEESDARYAELEELKAILEDQLAKSIIKEREGEQSLAEARKRITSLESHQDKMNILFKVLARQLDEKDNEIEQLRRGNNLLQHCLMNSQVLAQRIVHHYPLALADQHADHASDSQGPQP